MLHSDSYAFVQYELTSKINPFLAISGDDHSATFCQLKMPSRLLRAQVATTHGSLVFQSWAPNQYLELGRASTERARMKRRWNLFQPPPQKIKPDFCFSNKVSKVCRIIFVKVGGKIHWSCFDSLNCASPLLRLHAYAVYVTWLHENW